MILSAHQPAYLPWLGFFHKIVNSDVFVILDNVQFEKNSFINRNKIKTSNGEVWLTIPIHTAGHLNKIISEMEIAKNSKWQEKHWKSLEFNYQKAPYFFSYSDFFKKLYKKKWYYLTDILYETLNFFLKEFRIETKICRQSELGFNKKKQDLILEMCQYFNSDIFIFGKMGEHYADRTFFEKNNIKIFFQDYKCSIYPQLYDDFIPNLSIVDLLFNVGSEKALKYIMEENISSNELIKIN